MNCAAHDIGFVQHFLAEQNCWEEESPSGFAGAYGLAAVAAHDFHAAVQARSPVGSAEACSCAEFAGTHIPAAAAVCVVVVVVVVVVVAAAADNDADEYCSSSPFADEYSPAVAVDHVEGERSLVAAAEPCDAPVPAAAAVAVVVAAVAVVAAVFALIH
jgi:hypothetical protein